MWAMPKRAESRTRMLRMDGREWQVEERAETGADGRVERALVFSTAGETQRVREFNWLWFGFMDDELAALCRKRARATERATS